MKLLYIIACVSFFTVSNGMDIQVRLFANKEVQHLIINGKIGGYALLAATRDGAILDTIFKPMEDLGHHVIHVKNNSGKLQASHLDGPFGTYETLLFVPTTAPQEFLLSANNIDRLYEGSLRIRVVQGSLQIVNHIDIEKYVAGVVESEGGHVNEYEYFKAQAVLARTFVLKNINKHIKEGYNVKDDVTSQVYHGKVYLQNRININNATEETKGLVLVDKNNVLIFGAFHANSGGMTANSQDVWRESLHYLQSKLDPYSLNQPASHWQKKIPAAEVLDFFAKKLQVNGDKSELQRALSQFNQEKRERQFTFNGKHVLLKDVRHHLKLRSTYFSIRLEGNHFVFEGRGNGHGVGLSQEGAMEMAKRGFCFDEILYFYFSEILLKDLETLK